MNTRQARQMSKYADRKLAANRHAATIAIARKCSKKASTVHVAANASPTSCANLFGIPAENLHGTTS